MPKDGEVIPAAFQHELLVSELWQYSTYKDRYDFSQLTTVSVTYALGWVGLVVRYSHFTVSLKVLVRLG
jgi:hypothetical protein